MLKSHIRAALLVPVLGKPGADRRSYRYRDTRSSFFGSDLWIGPVFMALLASRTINR
jgi:hypothetical protein